MWLVTRALSQLWVTSLALSLVPLSKDPHDNQQQVPITRVYAPDYLHINKVRKYGGSTKLCKLNFITIIIIVSSSRGISIIIITTFCASVDT